MSRACVALLGLVALLPACGGERSAQDVALSYVRSDDPGKCADAAPAFLERQTGRSGDAARQACESAVRRTKPPGRVRVVSQRVRGDRAEVRLEADTQAVRVTLVRRDGAWAIDGLGG